MQSQNAAQLYAVQLFALRAHQGRLAEVEQSLEEFARRYPAAPVWRAATASAQAVLGRSDHARRVFEGLSGSGLADVPRDSEWLATVVLLIRAGAKLGDARRCAMLGELLAPYAGQAVVAGRGATCLGPVSRFVGIAARGGRQARRRDRPLRGGARDGAPLGCRAADRRDRVRAARTRSSAAGAARARVRAAARRGPRRSRAARAAAASSRAGGRRAAAGRRAADGRRRRHRTAPRRPARRTLAFYRRGDIWTIGPAGAQIQLRHAKGFTHVVRLLAAPRVEFHALDLVGGQRHGGPSAAAAAASGLDIHVRGGDSGPMLDAAAKGAYRARIMELEQEIAEAESFNDPERVARLRDELAFLLRELAGAVGLGGRDRKTGSDAERARVNVHARDPHGAQAHRRARRGARAQPRHRDPHRARSASTSRRRATSRSGT